MRRTAVVWVGLVAAAVATSGCDTFLFPGMDAAWECDGALGCADSDGLRGAPLETGAGELAGDFGRSRLEVPAAASVVGWHDPGTWGMALSTVEVQTDQDGWLSMAVVDLYGGVDHPDFASGAPVTYRIDDDVADSFALVTGCAGTNPAWWDFDTLADEVTVQVQPHPTDPAMRVVSFTAVFTQEGWTAPFPDGRTRLSGRFEVRAQ